MPIFPGVIRAAQVRARERLARREQTGKRSDQAARLVEGQRVMGWREALYFEPPAGLAALPPADLNLLDEVLTRLTAPPADTRLPGGD